MPWLRDLSKELLVRVLDLASDSSVLQLSVASGGLKNAVEECRPVSGEGPWCHPPGTWETSGLWRYLGLGDVTSTLLPSVTLRCEVKFQDLQEVLLFLKAAKALADDTIDNHVTFDHFVFKPKDVRHLYFGEDDHNGRWCTAGQTEVNFQGQLYCSIEAHRDDDDEVPWINVYVHWPYLPMKENPLICCSSLLLPELRMLASIGNIYDTHDLYEGSPLTELVRASRPLPMMLGVQGFDDV